MNMRDGSFGFASERGNQRIAVVGAGIAGLGAAWLLSKQHRVTLFEAGARLGGHANTVPVTLEGMTHPVDTGFLVFNRRTYPNLCALFEALQVSIAPSDMSFAFSASGVDLEWAGSNLATVFGQRRNLARPKFWGMLLDISRFNREASALVRDNIASSLTLGDYLDANAYGEAFRNWYLLPMAAAIWSCPTQQMLSYPLSTFLRFCHNHGLLQVAERPQWLTVRHGSARYVEALASQLQEVRLQAAVQAVRRSASGIELVTDRGAESFDQVVFACHSDQALKILGPSATPQERAVLGAVRYQTNRAVLHTDVALLPRRKRVWSAWNYMAASEIGAPPAVSVSYLINRLQPLPFKTPVIVSLNPFKAPDEAKVIAEIDYEHPVFDQGAVDAQAHLPALQGRWRTWFCGAWTGYGFHEDGLRSAVGVAAMLGAVAPWHAQSALFAEVAA